MAQDQDNFRDSIGTINEDGKRAWIFPKKPSGKFYEYRKYVSYVLLAFLFLAPFVKVNGNQFLMFNVLERRFNIFGFPFWPQDFHLFVISMIIGVIFIALFTVAFGRIFCGWMCPQCIPSLSNRKWPIDRIYHRWPFTTCKYLGIASNFYSGILFCICLV